MHDNLSKDNNHLFREPLYYYNNLYHIVDKMKAVKFINY